MAENNNRGDNRHTIIGHITDQKNGELLAGATVYIKETGTGATSDIDGFYSVSLPPGEYHLTYSFLGYQSQELFLYLNKDTILNIEMALKQQQLKEVVIESTRKDANVRKIEMGVSRMDMETVKKIPAIMGETDLIKALQLLPGVQFVSEGSSGFTVRGGSPDQNLLLLDQATVYNASHLLGFFSIFNNDAIRDVKLYKGNIPASAGGRLSSLIDVRMKEGNSKQFSGNGGLGTVSSRLTFEGPLIRDEASFLLSGRRSYADLFLALSSDEDVRNNTLYFMTLTEKQTTKSMIKIRFMFLVTMVKMF